MQPRVTPKQTRGQDRLADILEGARQHYGAVGRDAFTIREVAALANCSVATIYRYFGDRIALMDAIQPSRDESQAALERLLRALDQHREYEGSDLRVSTHVGWLPVRDILQNGT